MKSIKPVRWHYGGIREFLLELYDRLPLPLLRVTEPLILRLKIFILFLSELRVNVIHVQFKTNDDSLGLFYIGKSRQARKFMAMLGSCNFTSDRQRSLFFWEVNRHADRLSSENNLVVVNINRMTYRLIKPAVTFHMPESVASVLPLKGSLSDIRTDLSSNALRKIKECEKSDLRSEIHRDDSSLKHFYHEMYVPYIRKRFSELAEIESYHKVRRLMRTGFLLTVARDGKLISGAICRIRAGTFVLELIGVKNGDVRLLEKGAIDQIYYRIILLALDRKCSHINFGISRPFINDGLVQYKKRWGAVLTGSSKQCRNTGFSLSRLNGAHLQYFADNYPLIARKDCLSAIVTVNKEEPLTVENIKHFDKTYRGQGVRQLIVLSQSGFTAGAEEYGAALSPDKLRLIHMRSPGLKDQTDINDLILKE